MKKILFQEVIKKEFKNNYNYVILIGILYLKTGKNYEIN